MTLTKNKMVREIGQRTRLKNRDVQAMLEALIDVWTDELVSNGRIELENFAVIEVTQINTRSSMPSPIRLPDTFKVARVRFSKAFKKKLHLKERS